MQRKNNSKNTIEKIIHAATELFSEKGYDDTSIQNIVEKVGMSKGAVFHHFKSKEEIFYAVIDAQTNTSERITKQWISENKNLNGREKLIEVLFQNANSLDIHTLDKSISESISNPKMTVTRMQTDVIRNAILVANLIKEGNADGSLCVEQPDESAEVFLLLINIWCDVIIFPCSLDKFKARQRYLQNLMNNIGLDIVTEELIQLQMKMFQKLYKNNIEANTIFDL